MTAKKTCVFIIATLATHGMIHSEPAKLDSVKASNKNSGTIIVTISGQTVMQKSKLGQKVQQKLQAEQEQLAKPLQKDDEKVRAKEKELLDKKRALDKEAEEINSSKLLSQEAKQRKFEDLQDKIRVLEEDKSEFERLAKRLQADAKRVEAKMSQIYQEEMNKLDSKIRDGIKSTAEREGWDIVLMEEGIVYAGPSVSKTDMIIKELDAQEKDDVAKKPKVETTKPAPKK